MELKLKQLRKAKGLTQEQLGDKLSITKRVMGAYERQETPIPLEVAYEIALILGCSIDELAGLPAPECHYTDQRQADLNEYYEHVNDSAKQRIFQAAKDAFSNLENRIQKDRQDLRHIAVGA